MHLAPRRKMLISGLSALAAFAMLGNCLGEVTASTQNYGTKVSFRKGTPITFPDFTLTYLGTHQVKSPTYPRGFLYHDFDAVSNGKTMRVSWSSGTGDIGPAPFTISGHQFLLELSRSDKLGPLHSDELVVSRK